MCRFNGHCSDFYSVAQHSVMVSHLVPEHLAFMGLMHDAAEAYVGDVPTPIKQLIPQFKLLELHVWQLIARRFDLPMALPDQIKRADLQALATERKQLMPEHPAAWECLTGIAPVECEIKPWSPLLAEMAWMNRFSELTGNRL